MNDVADCREMKSSVVPLDDSTNWMLMNCTPPVMPRLLVVAEDGKARRALCGLLEQEGFCVIKAASGEAALKQIKHAPPDGVLFNLDAPNEQTALALRELMRAAEAAAVVVLAERGAASPPEIECGGPRRYLTKPCQRQELIAAIRETLAQRLAEFPPDARPRPSRRRRPTSRTRCTT